MPTAASAARCRRPPRRHAPVSPISLSLSPTPQSAKHLRPGLLAAAARAGFDLVPVSAAAPLAEQGPFDALLHKIRTPG